MASSEKQSYPKNLWTSTPRVQTRVLIPNQAKPSQIDHKIRFRDGVVSVANAYEEAIVRKVLKGQVYDQDLETPKVDEQTAWVCYSSAAYMAFLENRPPHTDPMRS